MNLAQAFGLSLPARVAVVGAGGKSTILLQLARQLEGIVWVTTTTHLGADQAALADQHVVVTSPHELALASLLGKKVSAITGPATPERRIGAPAPEVMARLMQLADDKRISVLVEADGSRMRPIKAPAAHEPAIPAWADVVVVVVGLSALGKPLSSQWVHRPERFAEVSGLKPGEPITVWSVRAALLHPLGGLKGIVAGARTIAVLNQADTEVLRDEGEAIARDLLRGGYEGVLIASLEGSPESGLWIS